MQMLLVIMICKCQPFITHFSPIDLHVSLSRATIRNAFLLLLVATSTWLCGLMAVNNSILAFYYIFDVLCLVQVGTLCISIHVCFTLTLIPFPSG